ncbi:LLM class flavin-dependent oxidoreductase [Leifsonia sp. NPDC058292]|uniref:LLM class flavin-dependent oxidoreductase n=1 Tax=Leifsonia sp. NPDC058292 TaxID=3346428 RepID=UPI0036DB5579
MSTESRIPLNVLDLANRPHGGTNADAVAGSIRLAQAAEELGYERFWVAEHHGMPAIASSAPAVLIAGIAAATKRIRVGSGGVMLPNHAPLVVAEQFGTLRALYGDRIDLGIGRAPGTDGATAMALRRSAEGLGVEDFPQQLLDLFGFFYGGLSDANPYHSITAVPGLGDAPQIWLLGSSGYSAQVAAALGIPFAFAHHFAGDNTEAALDLYRSRFEPSDTLSEPHSMIAVNVVADEDPERVRALSLPGQLSFLRMRQGAKPQPVSVEEALAYEFSPMEEEFIAARNARQAVGTPDEVKARLEALLASTKVDELMIASGAATVEGRIHSLEIVHEVLGASFE